MNVVAPIQDNQCNYKNAGSIVGYHSHVFGKNQLGCSQELSDDVLKYEQALQYHH